MVMVWALAYAIETRYGTGYGVREQPCKTSYITANHIRLVFSKRSSPNSASFSRSIGSAQARVTERQFRISQVIHGARDKALQ